MIYLPNSFLKILREKRDKCMVNTQFVTGTVYIRCLREILTHYWLSLELSPHVFSLVRIDDL